MMQRYDMIQTQFGMIARAYDDGDIYKVSEADPIIAKLEAENERLREERKKIGRLISDIQILLIEQALKEK